MNDIMTIAQSTFYRVARMKALYVILGICILDVAAMAGWREIALGLNEELMIDCALALCLVVGLITSMVSAFEIPRELRERTAQFILAKPMGRSAFIWGKFLGVGALCVFNVVIVAVGSLAAYRLTYGETPWNLLSGAGLVAAEAVTLTAIGLLLSVFLTDTMAAIGLFAFFAIGHAVHVLPRFVEAGSTQGIAQIAAYVLPNFHHLDVKTEISHGFEIPPAFVGMGAAYAVAYALAMVGLAIVLFSRKDIA